MDLPTLVACHQLALNADGRTIVTQKHYYFYECKLLEYLEQANVVPSLDALNANNLRNAVLWYRAREDHRRSRDGAATVRELVAVWRTLARWAKREGIYAHDPLEDVSLPKVTEYLREPFSEQELRLLWAASTQSAQPRRDEAILLMLLETGMRIGELVALDLGDLHLGRDELWLNVGAPGKGRRGRRVPFGDPEKRDGGRAMRALRAWLAEREQIATAGRAGAAAFLGHDGYRLTARGGHDLIARLGRAAQVAGAYPHRCRHTFATNYLILYPGDETGLRMILGQVSPVVMRRYVHFAESVIRQRARRASISEALLGGGTLRRLA